jgi:hypothetical protein
MQLNGFTIILRGGGVGYGRLRTISKTLQARMGTIPNLIPLAIKHSCCFAS